MDAATLLRETKWVLDLHEKAKKAGADNSQDYAKIVRQAHAAKQEPKASLAPAVHRLLADHALEDIEKVYPKVWEGILKEKRSEEPVRFR